MTIAVPKGQYVHGKQTYVITYTQQDVTKYFSDTGDDEFYWDVNGTGWEQPFGEVSATVKLTGSLASKLNGKTACYYGAEGSTTKCDITTSGSSFSATPRQDRPVRERHGRDRIREGHLRDGIQQPARLPQRRADHRRAAGGDRRRCSG